MQAFFVALILLFTSCSSVPRVRFERTGMYDLKKRPGSCRFELYLKDPPYDYDKLAVIWFPHEQPEHRRPRTPNAVMRLARPYVCRAGGNGLLLWRPTSDGFYYKGTIVHIHYDFEYEYDKDQLKPQEAKEVKDD